MPPLPADAASALEEARQWGRTAAALLDLSRSLAGMVTAEDVAQQVAMAAAPVVGCDAAVVFLWGADTTRLDVAGLSGWTDEQAKLIVATARCAGAAFLADALGGEEPLMVAPADDELVCRALGNGRAHAVAYVPIRARSEAVGILAVAWTAPLPDAVDNRLADGLRGLADQAAVALQNIRLLARITHQSLHDVLTGLPNQHLLDDRLHHALSRLRRTGGRVALLLLDLDRFKRVNDTMGHSIGNQLLSQVGVRLSTMVREGDTLARRSGDEFVLLLEDVDGAEDAVCVAEKVVAGFREPFELDGHQVYVTPSIGIAVSPDDGRDVDTLVRNADVAMYGAKERGGNTYRLHASVVHPMTYARLVLEADLHDAIAHGQLRLHYQPEVDLRTGRVEVVEALVRWEHPTLGVLFPGQFLPLAEESGLIVDLDAWALRTACAQAREWDAAGLPAVRVAVNLSGHHFRDLPRLAGVVTDALRSSGLPAERLELEVTESVSANDDDATLAMLDELTGSGVQVVIDDFGTGYSVFNRLRRFPVDAIKIDRSFIEEVLSADDEAPIVAAIIAMAHALKIPVVAEGVETQQQLEFLRRHDCELVQGYLLGRPVAPDDVDRLFAVPFPAA